MLKTYMVIKDKNNKDIVILDLSIIKGINISSDHIFINGEIINYRSIKTCYFKEYQVFNKNNRWYEIISIIENNAIHPNSYYYYKKLNSKIVHPFIYEFIEKFIDWCGSINGEKND